MPNNRNKRKKYSSTTPPSHFPPQSSSSCYLFFKKIFYELYTTYTNQGHSGLSLKKNNEIIQLPLSQQ